MRTTAFFRKRLVALLAAAGLCFPGLASAQEDYAGNFSESTGASNSYKETTVTLNGQQWYSNCCYKQSSEFRLGKNKASAGADIAQKFVDLGLDATNASVLEMQWDMENVASVSFSSVGKYGTVDASYILESTDGGNTYRIVATSNATDGVFTLAYTPESPVASARYALATDGTTPRIRPTEVAILVAKCEGPSNLQASPAVTTAELSWTAPASAPANGYLVTLTSGSGSPVKKAVAAGQTSTTVEDLAGSTRYEWSVASLCGPADTSEAVQGTAFTTLSATEAVVSPSGETKDYSIYLGETLSESLDFVSANLTADLSVQVTKAQGREGEAVISASPATIGQAEAGSFTVTLSSSAALAAGSYQDTLLISHDGKVLSKTVLNLVVDKRNMPKVAIEPQEGVFIGETTVTLSAVEGAKIHYTLDGETPSETAGGSTLLYSKPFTLADEGESSHYFVDIQALAFHDDYITTDDSLASAHLEFIQVTPAQLPLSCQSKSDINEDNGLFHLGLGSDYGSDPKLKFDDEKDALIAAFTSAPGALKYSIKGNTLSGDYIFSVEGSADGSSWETIKEYNGSGIAASAQHEDIQSIDARFRYIRWVYARKANGNIACGNIEILPLTTDPILNLTPDSHTLPAVAANGGSDSVSVRIFGKNLTENLTATLLKGAPAFSLDETAFASDAVTTSGDTLTVVFKPTQAGRDTALVEIGNSQIKDTLTVYATAIETVMADDIARLYEDYADLDPEQLYTVTGEVVITHKDDYNSRIYVQDRDNGASILLFGCEDFGYDDLAVGDVLTGVTGTLEINRNLLRFLPTEPLNRTGTGQTPAVQTLTAAQINASPLQYQSALVKIENALFAASGNFATSRNYNLIQGGDTIVFRTDYFSADYIGTPIPAVKMDVTGILTQYNQDMQITARGASDMTESPCLVPSGFESSTTATTAVISFEGDAASYAYRYGTQDADWDNAEHDTVQTASFSLDKLTASTTYYYQVKSLCSGTNASEWSSTQSFATKAADAPALTVTSPKADSTYTGDVTFAFAAENFELGADGLVKIMISNGDTLYTSQASRTVFLKSGSYRAGFELVKLADSASLDEPVTVPAIRFSVNLPDAAMPVFSPDPEKVYSDSVRVTIACETEGASIFYSTDGSRPSQAYAGAFTLKTTSTVKAFAVMEKMDTSAIASAQYTILSANPVPEGDLVLNEGFEACQSTYGNPGAECSMRMDDFTSVKGWSGTSVYPAESSMKMGTGSKAGKLVTPALDLSYDNGKYFVAFLAMAWKGNETEIRVVAGNDTLYARHLDNSGDYARETMREYVFELDNGTSATQISFEAIQAKDNRFFIDSVRVYQTLPQIPLLLVNGNVEINTVQAVAASYDVTVNGKLLSEDVSIDCPEGNFSVNTSTLPKDSVMREEGAVFTITYNGALLSDSCTITLASGTLSKEVKVRATAEEVIVVADLAELRQGEQGKLYRVEGQAVLTAYDDYRNYKFFQDDKAGILVDDPNGLVENVYEIGDGVENLYGQLGSFGGQLQLIMQGNLPEASSHGNAIEPIVLTVDEFESGIEEYCSRLIRINGLELIEAAQWEANADHLAVQGQDTINIRTFIRNGDFVGEAAPQGSFDLIGIAGVYNGSAQISPRTRQDILTAGSDCAAPFNLQVSGGDCSPVTVSWEGAVSSYVLALLNDDGTDTIFTDTLQETSYTFTSLSCDVLYGWAVASICDDGSLRWARGENFMMTVANEETPERTFRLYPNPAPGRFYIELDSRSRIEIFSANGTLVKSREMGAGRHEMTISQPGIYFVRIENGKALRVVIR